MLNVGLKIVNLSACVFLVLPEIRKYNAKSPKLQHVRGTLVELTVIASIHLPAQNANVKLGALEILLEVAHAMMN